MSTKLRENMTRDSQSRKDSYKPQSILDTPPPPQGYKYRWVRHSLFDEDQTSNVRKHIQDGWEVVSAKEIDPEVAKQYESLGEGRFAGTICQRDVLLMKIPDERAEAIREYYEGVADRLVSSVDQEKQNLGHGLGIRSDHIEFENKSKTDVSRKPIFS